MTFTPVAPGESLNAGLSSKNTSVRSDIPYATGWFVSTLVERIERGGEDALIWELELLEDPTRPSRRHRAAVLIPESDARHPQLHPAPGEVTVDGVKAHADLARDALHDRTRRRLGAYIERARRHA